MPHFITLQEIFPNQIIHLTPHHIFTIFKHQDQAMLQAASPSTNDQALHQMFEQFLSYQATNTISKVKFECTANSEIFSSNGRNTELMYEKLEGFITALNFKMAFNTDCYLTEISQIAYIFSHISNITKSVTPGEKLPNIPFQIPNAEMSS